MNALSVTLEKWAAWAPGIDTPELWQQWSRGESDFDDQAKPDVSFLPAMFRRRLSFLSRMALLVANQCVDEEQSIRTVFCSRHGELHRTAVLLQELARSEMISPTAFSMAVHNTASGLFSIANNDRSVTTALAGGVDGFESAFMECATILASGECDKVLLVVADQPLPEVLESFSDEWPATYAAAFVLSNSQAKNNTLISLAISPADQGEKATYPHALEFIRFILSNRSDLSIAGSRLDWQWSQHAA